MQSTSHQPSLKSVIFFLIDQSSYEIGITKLMKLVFLADVEHVQLYGERLCDIDWTWYNYGPFSRRVYDSIEALDSEGYVQDVLTTERGSVGRSSMPTMAPSHVLGARHRYTLRRVLDRYGSLSVSAIKQVAYATETMRQAEPGMQLDVMQEPHRSLTASNSALSSLLERSGEPDTRSWGNAAESADEDMELLEELSTLRNTANSMHDV